STGLLNASCAGGRACTPEELDGWTRRPLRDVRHALPAACEAIERAFARGRRSNGRALRCGPDVEALADAHAGDSLGEVFSDGSLRFGLLRALLDGGAPGALDAALDWLALRPGPWVEAQQSWEAARRYDGELPALPAATWREFEVALFKRV